MSSSMEYSIFIGHSLKDETGKEIGQIQSYLIDSSGQIKDAFVKTKNEDFIRAPVERLKVDDGQIFLASDIEKRTESLAQKLPILRKKKEILDNLYKNNDILSEVYENISGEINKSLDETMYEAQSLLGDIEKQIQDQENSIKVLHLARTYLEMEHGIGKVEQEVYQQSLASILKETKDVSYRKLNLAKEKEKLSSILKGEEKTEPSTELTADQSDAEVTSTDVKPVITVHVTQE